MITRHYAIEKLIKPNKMLVMYGPRRVGKTTLLVSIKRRTFKLRPNQKTGAAPNKLFISTKISLRPRHAMSSCLSRDIQGTAGRISSLCREYL